MRLIDADALSERLNPYINKYCGESFPYDIVHDAFIYEIEHEPTVDAVPVIRCKDCIHNVSNRITDPLCINDYSGDDIVCDYFETDGMEPDDYCSRAERKENA